ncbi:MAG TPA: NAD-dependent epimerase/dehydratase family protein [Thermotogota bacterium]|nr:NAD-dependent epimerase/dehydratase family protein [Thermotogota bacterium]
MKQVEYDKFALVLGGGGFIGGHLAKRLKERGYWVRIVDIKPSHEFFNEDEICNEYICGDLRNINVVSNVMFGPRQHSNNDAADSFDEVYQLAADMGGAGYVFTKQHDADIMHNSALINLNVAYEATKKHVKKLFYSSSACIYPERNQLDPDNPNCAEDSAYPAAPDSEYGWEKLFSERLYLSFKRNYGLNVRIARFHNIFGPYGTWDGGKEKAPAAMLRKALTTPPGETFEVWGDGKQTRSFLYIDECIDGIFKLMNQDEFIGPVNIGSDEMISIAELASMAITIAIDNVLPNGVGPYFRLINGEEFYKKYGYECPVGVRGRNSDNTLIKQKLNWAPSQPLQVGMIKTAKWIWEVWNKQHGNK